MSCFSSSSSSSSSSCCGRLCSIHNPRRNTTWHNLVSLAKRNMGYEIKAKIVLMMKYLSSVYREYTMYNTKSWAHRSRWEACIQRLCLSSGLRYTVLDDLDLLQTTQNACRQVVSHGSGLSRQVSLYDTTTLSLTCQPSWHSSEPGIST